MFTEDYLFNKKGHFEDQNVTKEIRTSQTFTPVQQRQQKIKTFKSKFVLQTQGLGEKYFEVVSQSPYPTCPLFSNLLFLY